MNYSQITLEERYRLYALRGAETSQAAIARELGRHRSTIYRELRRNRSADGPSRPYPARTRTQGRRRAERAPCWIRHAGEHEGDGEAGDPKVCARRSCWGGPGGSHRARTS